MRQLGFIGIDQYNNSYQIHKHPRKELMEQTGCEHAEKMYCDTKDGCYKHIGYVIGGHWIRVFRVMDWKNADN